MLSGFCFFTGTDGLLCYSAENGCYIKPKPTRATPKTTWINMVSNFNLTWKSSCLEILNYVSASLTSVLGESARAY